MTKVFAFIGVLAVAFIAAILSFGVLVFVEADNKIDDGTAYARSVLETYGKDWDADFIRDHASPELLATGADFELIALQFTQVFGTIEQLDSFECPSWQQSTDSQGLVFALACRSSARSTKGQLDIEIHVLKRDEWKTNVIWVHNMVPRQNDPYAQPVNLPMISANGLGSEPGPQGCGTRVSFNSDGLTIGGGCMASVQKHVEAH